MNTSEHNLADGDGALATRQRLGVRHRCAALEVGSDHRDGSALVMVTLLPTRKRHSGGALQNLAGFLGVLAIGLSFFFALASSAFAATFSEDFAAHPGARGWSVYGNTNLFQWDAARQRLEVTWDSTLTNSYFRCPLNTILGKADSFTLGFDLYLMEAAIGITPDKPYSFEVALGFHNSLSATRANFQRGRGAGAAPNLVEFDYFPEYYHPNDNYSHQATVWPALIATNGSFNYDNANSYVELALPTNTWMRVQMSYDAGARELLTTIRTNAGPFVTGQEGALLKQLTVRVMANFTDYRVDYFAISSYSDQGGTGSLRARGWVDNVSWSVPDPPVQNFTGAVSQGLWQAGFASQTNWLYVSETSTNLTGWQPASAPMAGTGEWLSLPARPAAATAEFYRVRALRP